jgi:hypothetical protein
MIYIPRTKARLAAPFVLLNVERALFFLILLMFHLLIASYMILMVKSTRHSFFRSILTIQQLKHKLVSQAIPIELLPKNTISTLNIHWFA